MAWVRHIFHKKWENHLNNLENEHKTMALAMMGLEKRCRGYAAQLDAKKLTRFSKDDINEIKSHINTIKTSAGRWVASIDEARAYEERRRAHKRQHDAKLSTKEKKMEEIKQSTRDKFINNEFMHYRNILDKLDTVFLISQRPRPQDYFLLISLSRKTESQPHFNLDKDEYDLKAPLREEAHESLSDTPLHANTGSVDSHKHKKTHHSDQPFDTDNNNDLIHPSKSKAKIIHHSKQPSEIKRKSSINHFFDAPAIVPVVIENIENLNENTPLIPSAEISENSVQTKSAELEEISQSTCCRCW